MSDVEEAKMEVNEDVAAEQITKPVPVATSATSMPKEEVPTKEQEILFTEKQKEVVLSSLEERTFFQNKTQEALKKEGEIVSLVIDGAGIDNSKVAGAKLNDERTGLIVDVVIE